VCDTRPLARVSSVGGAARVLVLPGFGSIAAVLSAAKLAETYGTRHSFVWEERT
jgi:ActR/RegA family two-component response regulator